MRLTNKFGNEPKNQEIMGNAERTYFKSYGTVIATIDHTMHGQVTLDGYYWNYSVTTGYYRNQFLGEGIADTRKKIKSGVYKLANLN